MRCPCPARSPCGTKEVPALTRVIIPASNVWIELYNREGSAVDLTGWKVDDVANVGAAANRRLLTAEILHSIRPLAHGVRS